MPKPVAIALLAFALAMTPAISRAQSMKGTSLAIGGAMALGDLAQFDGAGFDADLQLRTERIIGPLSLRIDGTYTRLSGKYGLSPEQFSSQGFSLTADLGDRYYWWAGPGLYQSNTSAVYLGHKIVDQRSYIGAQIGIGANVPVFGLNTFFEAGLNRAFSAHENNYYLPVRFGYRF